MFYSFTIWIKFRFLLVVTVAIMADEIVLDPVVQSTVYMKQGRSRTVMKIEIFSNMFMWDRNENKKNSPSAIFFFFTVLLWVLFSYILFSEKSTAETGLKCICVYIHPALKRVGLSPASGMISVIAVSCKHLLLLQIMKSSRFDPFISVY